MYFCHHRKISQPKYLVCIRLRSYRISLKLCLYWDIKFAVSVQGLFFAIILKITLQRWLPMFCRLFIATEPCSTVAK